MQTLVSLLLYIDARTPLPIMYNTTPVSQSSLLLVGRTPTSELQCPLYLHQSGPCNTRQVGIDKYLVFRSRGELNTTMTARKNVLVLGRPRPNRVGCHPRLVSNSIALHFFFSLPLGDICKSNCRHLILTGDGVGGQSESGVNPLPAPSNVTAIQLPHADDEAWHDRGESEVSRGAPCTRTTTMASFPTPKKLARTGSRPKNQQNAPTSATIRYKIYQTDRRIPLPK